MKRIASALLVLLFASTSLLAQSASELYKQRFSYDLKTDKESVRFDGKTFWLRMSVLKNDTLTLTYFLKGDTPTTASEFLTFQILTPATSVDTYVDQLSVKTRSLSLLPMDVIKFGDYPGGHQSIASVLIQDAGNNLLEDSIFRVTQLDGKPLWVAAHTKRLKLSDVGADADKASTAIGDHRNAWLKQMGELKFPFEK